MRRCAVGLVLLFVSLLVSAIPVERVEQVGREWGIDGTITAIGQCADGFLWVGTPLGLYRLDGTAVRLYRRGDDGLPDDRITALYTDSSRLLWVGTATGLARYSSTTRTFSPALSDVVVTTLTEDSRGTIWIGTAGFGVVSLQPETGYTTRLGYDPNSPRSIASNDVTALAADRRGTLWVGTGERGLSRINVVGGQSEHFRFNPSVAGLVSDRITSLLVDRSGRLWVGTADRGYGTFTPGSERADDSWFASDAAVTRLVEQRSSVLLAAAGGRIDRLESTDAHAAATPDVVVSSFGGHPTVTALFEDTAGGVWVGTHASGLGRLRPEYGGVVTGLSQERGEWGATGPTVWAFAEEDSGAVLVATDGHGLYRYRPADGVVTPTAAPSDAPIYGVAAGRAGDIWLARGPLGVVRVDAAGVTRDELAPRSHGRGFPADAAYTVAVVDDRHLAIGSPSGLLVFDRVSRSYLHPTESDGGAAPPRGHSVTALAAASGSGVWVGTDRGYLGRYDAVSGLRWYRVPGLVDADRPTPVWSIQEQPDGSVWLAARDAGAIHFDRRLGVIASVQPHGPAGVAPVYGAVTDPDATLWVTGPSGVFRYTPDQASGTPLRFSSSDGLHVGMPAAGAVLAAGDGSVYVGGGNGFSRLDPLHLVADHFTPPVVTLEVESPIGASHAFGERITGDAFAVTLAAIDLTGSHASGFSYLLEGFDDSWSTGRTGDRLIYRDLPAGTYRLMARGVNRNGVEGPETVVLEVVSERRDRDRVRIAIATMWLVLAMVGIAGIATRS